MPGRGSPVRLAGASARLAAQACLDTAEKRVEELLSIGADGAPIVRVLDNGES